MGMHNAYYRRNTILKHLCIISLITSILSFEFMILYSHSFCVCMHALCLGDVVCILHVEMLCEQFGPVLLWVVGSNFN